ncbi:MAG: helix-turn-helix domain-containing protein [Planctomycetota bacterium]
MVHLIVIEKDEARDIVLDALHRKGYDVVVQSVRDEKDHATTPAPQCPEGCSAAKMLDVLEKRFREENPGESFYRFVLKTIEKPMIEKTLKKTGGNQLAAARMLGINRNTLRSKIRRLGVRLPGIGWSADGVDLGGREG